MNIGSFVDTEKLSLMILSGHFACKSRVTFLLIVYIFPASNLKKYNPILCKICMLYDVDKL